MTRYDNDKCDIDIGINNKIDIKFNTRKGDNTHIETTSVIIVLI